ncbi:hypothetical protein [Streptomyces sp. NPDC059080]|uniref:hypothetical protein n=1 Tax=Streptomyces sp. NPDC059080 TaxID=3346718 RepID=UPI003691F360
MSLHDELTAAERTLDELVRAVERLERRLGDGLDIRRVRTDTDHLGESLRLLRAGAGTARTTAPDGDRVVPVPDTPYDSALWSDAEDEGLGAKDRHAP